LDIQGTVTSANNNLVGNGGGSSGITDGTNGNHVGSNGSPIDPHLGPLQNNGGPTLTEALLPGSPAIGGVPANTSGTPSTDQRGHHRNLHKPTDIGAFQT
jgi:hypothetical protein